MRDKTNNNKQHKNVGKKHSAKQIEVQKQNAERFFIY